MKMKDNKHIGKCILLINLKMPIKYETAIEMERQ